MTKLLLIDHSRCARTGLADSLQRRTSVDVIDAVADGPAAARSLAPEQPDLVLIDSHIGEESNEIVLCADVRRLTHVPIVVLTSSMTPERWSALNAAGANEFILKKAPMAALEWELERIGKSLGPQK